MTFIAWLALAMQGRCADMVNNYFVLFIVFVQLRLTQSQSGICESSGFCQETEGTCQHDINSCFPGSGAVLNKNVTFDDEGAGEKVPTCNKSRWYWSR